MAAPKTPFGKVKKTYSGKVGGRNDDVVTHYPYHTVTLFLTYASCACQVITMQLAITV